MIYLIFTLQQKPIWIHAREGVSTSGIHWDEGDAFLQPMRTRKTVLSRRELLRYAARRPNGRDAARLRAPRLHFAGYLPAEAGEFVDKMNSKLRELGSDRRELAQFQKTKQTKTPVTKGRGSKSMAVKPTPNSTERIKSEPSKENIKAHND